MTLIEAKVEAALVSRMLDRRVQIMQNSKDAEDFFLEMGEELRKDATTWYTHGCEKGVGYQPPVSKNDEKPKRKKSAEELIDAIGEPKPKREKATKQPTELKTVEVKNIVEAVKLTESCKVKFGGKEYVLSIKGSWAVSKPVIEQCKDGLVLVIKDIGYYFYPKSMWNELDSIFKSSTYENGKPYSQSVLPKKFEKYFKKF